MSDLSVMRQITRRIVENDLNSRWMGVIGLNPYAPYTSASRLAMFCSQIGQTLVVKGSTVKRTFTGMEREYGKDVHSIRMPCNGVILRVIEKYPNHNVPGSAIVGENPVTTIIYENEDSPTREIGCIHIPRHHCLHQHYGFNYVKTPDFYRARHKNARLDKGTVLATSPSITANGDYKFGLEAQVAYMSVPGVNEDGFIVSESFCQRTMTKGYGKRVLTFGRTMMPLNLHGTDDNYKFIPDIGERVGANGLLFATRAYDETLAPVMMTSKSLRKTDYFDKPIHAVPHAKVIDVVVLKGNREKVILPHGMEKQARYYHERSMYYYRELYDLYRELERRHGNTLHIEPQLHRLLVKTESLLFLQTKSHVTPVINKQSMDEWVVEITFEYDVVPGKGFKIADMFGGKGIIVAVWPDKDMPLDAMGNRAEIIMDGDSTCKRMNVGRMYEHYIEASARETSTRIRHAIQDGVSLDETWDYLLGFYEIVSPPHYKNVLDVVRSPDQIRKHVDDVAKNGIYRYQPTDNPVKYNEVIRDLAKYYPACRGPVTYTAPSGRVVTTKSRVLIGGKYILLLEKTGHDWSGVSSAKLQHFGIPARLSTDDKYSSAGRHQPVRTMGESEMRLLAAVCGGDICAELLDRNNNPAVHRNICENILRAPQPSNIDNVVNRDILPRGQGRVVTFVNHVLECGGIRFKRIANKDKWGNAVLDDATEGVRFKRNKQ